MSNTDQFILKVLVVYVAIQAVVLGAIQVWMNRREKRKTGQSRKLGEGSSSGT